MTFCVTGFLSHDKGAQGMKAFGLAMAAVMGVGVVLVGLFLLM